MRLNKTLKWIGLIIIFIVISFSFFHILTYMMKPYSVSLLNIAGFYGEKKNSLDMVYIGGSATFTYWEPLRAFEKNGIASYNFAANSISAESYLTMIKEIFKRQSPKLIIIDARTFQYREESYPNEVDYRNVLTGMPVSFNRMKFIQKNVPKYLKQDTLQYHFDIIKYHREVEIKNTFTQIKMALGIYENPIKGFYFVPKVEKQPIGKPIKTKNKTPIDRETEEILIELLNYIKQTNCKYLFIVSPYGEEELHKENFNYISELINSYGYDFIDANDFYQEMNINFDTDFYNYAHTNIFGADKYTDFLANYITENYQIPDRSEEYKDWINLLPEWKKEVDKTKETINQLIQI